MSDDDLIRRGDVLRLLQSGAGLTLNGQARRVAALPAVMPGVKVKPTDAQVASACMSYRHDFGLLDGLERTLVLHQARDWLEAWQKEIDLTPQPAPDVARLVDALERLLPVALHYGGLTDKHVAAIKNAEATIRKFQTVDAALAAMEGKL